MKWAAVLATGYGVLLGAARLGHRVLLYPAPRHGSERLPSDGEIVTLTAADGVPVQAWLRPPVARAPWVVFFHGNGETLADAAPLGRALSARGLGFAALEYRGYGAAPAEGPTEAGLYHDAEALLRALADRGLPPTEVTLWGHSLGSGVATEMMVRGHATRLVLTAPFTSIPAMAQRIAPFLPGSWVIGDRFDNLAKAPRILAPALVIHGNADRVVPYAMGGEVARALPQGRLETVPGAGHNDLFAADGDRLLDLIAAHARGE